MIFIFNNIFILRLFEIITLFMLFKRINLINPSFIFVIFLTDLGVLIIHDILLIEYLSEYINSFNEKLFLIKIKNLIAAKQLKII